MNINKYKISIVICGIYLISSFVPIVQIMMGYLNGAFLTIPEYLTGIRSYNFTIGINLIMSIIFLYSYLKSSKKSIQVVYAIITSFFINCTVLYIFEDYFIDTNIYQVQFIIGALLIGSSLFLMDWLRIKSSK